MTTPTPETPSSPTTESGPVLGGQRGSGTAAQPGTAEPDPVQEKWKLAVAKSAGEARQGTAPILAATGLVIWCIQNYGFHNQMPLPVSAAMWTLVPTVIGYLSTHVTVKKVTL